MAFVPASSIAPATVTVAGVVSVSNLPADQLVHFTQPITVDASGFAVPVTGPLTDTQLAARLPLSVTGPLTDAQLAARLPLGVSVGNFPADQLVHFVTPINVNQGTSPWVVDGSAVTQPVSVDALPLPDGAATEETLTRVNGAVQDVALAALLEREKVE